MKTSPRSTCPTQNGGFILLLSVLIISIILAISFSIYSLSIKEVVLSSFLRDSEKAFIAADRTLECALYWERSYPQNGLPYTAFATSSQWIMPPNYNSIVVCDEQQITLFPPPQPAPSTASAWEVATTLTPPTGKTFFRIIYPDKTCADVTVDKTASLTTVTSNGYNDCNVQNPRRTQRTIQVTTNY